MRDRKLRYRLGHLVVAAMLFTQSALLWAQVTAPVHTRHPMQHDCHSQQVMTADSAKLHCKQDCCQPDQPCSEQCLSTCVTAGVTLPPTAIISVFPYFDTMATYSAMVLPPDGRHGAVLERPPRYIA